MSNYNQLSVKYISMIVSSRIVNKPNYFTNDLVKNLFMFAYLTNQPSLIIDLDLTMKQVKLKYNNLFVNKFISMMLDLIKYL